ncbi:laccase domain protein YlmD [Clostridia bacterium]|nr:laccase domain protein YlmD [Clostridia bacterium]
MGLEYFTFDNLTKAGVRHCFTYRTGGVSAGCFSSLNLSYTRGDKDENVSENFRRICEAAGFERDSLVFSNQIHKTKIAAVSDADKGKTIKEADGLTALSPNVTLTTFYADCVPLFFFDKKSGAVASVHAGWRGTAAKIAREAIIFMGEAYGTNPADIIAGIGPSICADCFEVDISTALNFSDYPQFVETCGEKRHINLQGVNREIMEECGIPPENIEISGLCTKHNPDLFYSHRRTGAERGSMCAFISAKSF